jgi:hypothetical protein
VLDIRYPFSRRGTELASPHEPAWLATNDWPVSAFDFQGGEAQAACLMAGRSIAIIGKVEDGELLAVACTLEHLGVA